MKGKNNTKASRKQKRKEYFPKTNTIPIPKQDKKILQEKKTTIEELS